MRSWRPHSSGTARTASVASPPPLPSPHRRVLVFNIKDSVDHVTRTCVEWKRTFPWPQTPHARPSVSSGSPASSGAALLFETHWCLQGKQATVNTNGTRVSFVSFDVLCVPRHHGRSFVPTRSTSPMCLRRDTWAAPSGATGCKFQREFSSIPPRQRSVVLNLKQQDRLFDSLIFYVKSKSSNYLSDCKYNAVLCSFLKCLLASRSGAQRAPFLLIWIPLLSRDARCTNKTLMNESLLMMFTRPLTPTNNYRLI